MSIKTITVKKRDGRIQEFDSMKIYNSMLSASIVAQSNHSQKQLQVLTASVLEKLVDVYGDNGDEQYCSEKIYDIVVGTMSRAREYALLGAFIDKRELRDDERQSGSKLMQTIAKIVKETTKDNANVQNSPSGKMLQIGDEASKVYTLKNMPKHIARAHTEGRIHIHDLGYYEKTSNCLQIPIGKLLAKGFDAGRGYIRAPKRISTATALTAVIIQCSQNDLYGGQSSSHFDRDMAPYVPAGYAEALEGSLPTNTDEAARLNYAHIVDKIRNEVYQAMEALIYNLNSLMSRAGSQVPFSSLNLGTDTTPEGRLVTEMLLRAHIAGLGHGETALFPNLIFRIQDGINKKAGDPNYDLRLLAQEDTAKRMNPTYSNMDSTFNLPYGDEVSYMGCRSRVIKNCNGPAVVDGRGNIAFVTMNLVAPALEIEADQDYEVKKKKYYRKIDKLISICEEQLIHRYHTLCQLKGKDIPFVVSQELYMDSEKIGPEDSIEPMLKHGTLSVGFIGLAEAIKYLYGQHHGESQEAWNEAFELTKYMADKVHGLTEVYGLNFTFFSTPAEGLSGRFTALDKEKYGVIPWITDKEYYTNSYQIPVDFNISIKEKFRLEGPFHALTSAGHISYAELKESPWYNPKAIEDMTNYAFDQCDMGYVGYNFPLDECPECHKSGIIPDDCDCGCDSSRILRIRRVSGYLSSKENFTPGKSAELRDRISHN